MVIYLQLCLQTLIGANFFSSIHYDVYKNEVNAQTINCAKYFKGDL